MDRANLPCQKVLLLPVSPNRRHIKKLENFHMRAVWFVLGICWQDHATNLEVLARTESTSINSIIIKAPVRWVGHVFRMQVHRIPRRLLYGELVHGKRHTGRHKKRDIDCIKANLHWCKVKPKELEEHARDRSHWRAVVKQASARNRRHSATPARQQTFRAPVSPD